MHDIVTRIGATNVRWVWAPSNVDVPDVSSNRMEAFYPGSSYVDILGVDGYNWGSGVAGGAGWQSFSQVFSDAYNRLSALGSQPIWITEVGGAPQGGDKSAWVRDMFAKAQGMSRLEAIVWFNEDKERDWRAAPSSEVASAFAPPVAGARSNARPR
jgi:beta-mannanase